MGVRDKQLLPVKLPKEPELSGLPDLCGWNQCTGPVGGAAPVNLSSSDKAVAEDRFSKIEPLLFPERFRSLWQEFGGKKSAIEKGLAARHAIHARTLRHWKGNYEQHGLMGLVRRDRDDKGIHRKINRAASDFILAMAIPKPGVFGALSGKEIFRAYEEERAWRAKRLLEPLSGADAKKYARYLNEAGQLSESAMLPEVDYRTLVRCIADIPEAVRTFGREGKEAYKNTQEIISHRNLESVELLEWLVCDHRLLDIFCLVPVVGGGWKLARPWFSAGIDMRSRRWLGWGVFAVPSSDAIATILKKVCINHGVPTNCYWDNGKDYRCEYLEGKQVRRASVDAVADLGPTWRGVLGTLGIRVTHAIVRNARAKIIEPNFVRLANFDKQLPEYCGHRPSERPERFDAMVKQHEEWKSGKRKASPFRTIQQIANLYDQVIDDLNEQPLEGQGMRKVIPNGHGWMSPAECWDSLIGRVVRRTVRLEDIHVVFSKRKDLTVKHGEVCATFGGQKFHYRLKAEPTQLMAVNGQVIQLAFDPHDLGQAAVYWKDRFIGLAECVPLRKMGEDAFVEDERNRRAAQRGLKELVGMIHKTPTTGPEERLARRQEVRPVRSASAQAEVPLALPEPIQQASEAFRADRDFDFSAAELPDMRCISMRPDIDDGSDDHFQFFSGETR